MMRSMRYQPIFHTLYFTLHCTCVLHNVVITTVIEMVEMVEILDGRVGKHSVERIRYVILGHCEIWSHFTCTLYCHSPSSHDNTDATRQIWSHISR